MSATQPRQFETGSTIADAIPAPDSTQDDGRFDNVGLSCPECGEDYRTLPPWLRDQEVGPCETCGQHPALDPFRARIADIRKEVEDYDRAAQAGLALWPDMIGQRRQRYTANIFDDALWTLRSVLDELHRHSLGWIDDIPRWNNAQDDPEAIAHAERHKALVNERMQRAEILLCELHEIVEGARRLSWPGEDPPAPRPSVTLAEHWNIITRRKFFWDIRRLAEVPADPDDNWRYRLRVARGVYLIRDLRTGVQYVGAAYGENGLWRRFKEYLKTNGHGDNKRLIEYVNTHPDHALHVKVLHWASTSRPDLQEILDQENHWKFVLGTREGPLGLNAN